MNKKVWISWILSFCTLFSILSSFADVCEAKILPRLTDGAFASSTQGMGWEAEKACDSDVFTSYASISHGSNQDATEWVAVDLGHSYTGINKLRLYPRDHGYGFPVNFKLQYSLDGQTWMDIPGTSQTGYDNPEFTEQVFNVSPLTARFIRLYATKLGLDENNTARLQLAELAADINPDTDEYSRVWPVNSIASSVSGSGYSAENASDNNLSTYWSSINRTEQQTVEWMYFDLGKRYAVDSIQLVPRIHGYGFPVDFKLQYSVDAEQWSDIPGQSYINYTNPGEIAQNFTFAPVIGQYFRIYAAKLGSNGPDYSLQLAEMEIRSNSPFSSDIPGTFNADLNNMWLQFTAYQDGTNAVHPTGDTPTYFDWAAQSKLWSGDNQMVRGLIKTKIRDYPISGDGYTWAWWSAPVWPTSGSRFYETNPKYIIAVWRIAMWDGAGFLDEMDQTTVTLGEYINEDVSEGLTVWEKTEMAMNYLLDDLGGSTGLLTITDPAVNGTPSGKPTNYFDTWPAGYKDPYTNAYFYQAVTAMSELEKLRGNKSRADYYSDLADDVRTTYNNTFFHSNKRRYITTISSQGIGYDFGAVSVNVEAAAMGLPDSSMGADIYDWLDGNRTISGDTSTGADIYYYTFSPRANTLKFESINPPWWYDMNGAFPATGNCSWDQHQVNGGTILYWSFHDVLGRLRYSDTNNAFARFQKIISDFGVDELRRDPLNDYNYGWRVGTIDEFPENGLVPTAFFYGFMGVNATFTGLDIAPNIPSGATFLEAKNVLYRGREYDIKVWEDRIRIRTNSGCSDMLSGRIGNLASNAAYKISNTDHMAGTTVTTWVQSDNNGEISYFEPVNGDRTIIVQRESGASGIGAATLISPSDDAAGVEVSPVFSWDQASGAANYTLMIDDDRDFSSPVFVQNGIAGTQYTLPAALGHEKTYYWRILAENGNYRGSVNDCFAFETAAATSPDPGLLPPGDFSLSLPGDTQAQVESGTTFTWTGSEGAASYSLVVDNDSSFSSPVFQQDNITATSYTMTSHLPGASTYYWKVTAVNDYGSKEANNNGNRFTTRGGTMVSYDGQDTATQGSWRSGYGGDGYVLFGYGDAGEDVQSLPSYVKWFKYQHGRRGRIGCTFNTRFLEPPSGNRIGAYLSSGAFSAAPEYTEICMSFHDSSPHEMALYLYSYDEQGAEVGSVRVDLLDAANSRVIDTRIIANLSSTPVYLKYTVKGDIKIHLKRDNNSSDMQLGGIFWGNAQSSGTPGAFSLSTPADESSTTNTRPAFHWTPSNNATGYTLVVADNPWFNCPKIYASGIQNTSYTPDKDLPWGTYYWNVIAVNTNGTRGASVSGGNRLNIGEYSTDVSLVTSISNLSDPANTFTGDIGMKFTTGGQDLIVSQLGRYYAAGNSGRHTLKIVRLSDGATMASADIDMSQGTVDSLGFKHAILSSPVRLAANTAYYLVSSETSGGDLWYGSSSQPAINTVGAIVQNGTVWKSTGSWNPGSLPGYGYGPLDMKFHVDEGVSAATGVANLVQLRNNFTGDVGMQIRTGVSTLLVSHLGRYHIQGNSGMHTLKIVNRFGEILASADTNMDTGSPDPLGYKYVELSSPVILAPNSNYYIVSSETNGGDQWYGSSDLPILSSIQQLEIIGPVWSTGSGWNASNSTGLCYVPVSFKAVNRETSLVSGITNLSELRNNFTGEAGMKITVNSSPMTVSKLGRYYVPGNSGMHTLKLVRASDGVTVAMAEIDMSAGNPDGQGFKYSKLATPVTLQPGNSYYLVSSEANDGDQWYGINNPPMIHSTGAVTVNSTVWSTGTGWNEGLAAGYAYGPVNLIY